MKSQQQNYHEVIGNRAHITGKESQSIDWYAEGEERIIKADGIQVVVRFVGRKGRRGRIAIMAPPGAVFSILDKKQQARQSCHQSFAMLQRNLSDQADRTDEPRMELTNMNQ